MSAAAGIEVALKENGLIVDMSPAAMMTQAALNTNNLRLPSSDNSPEASDPIRRCSISPTNLSNTASMATFRCERCDTFETQSRPSLLLHVVQCLSSPTTARLKTEDNGMECKNEVTSPNNVEMRATKNSPQDSQLSNSVNGTGVIVAPAKGSANSTAATSSSSSSSSRKVFECDVCNMKFSNGANMRRHKMRHTGVKPYECRVCQKRFFRKDHLAEHFTTHTKTLPYHCPICNRGFQRQIAMRAHFQNEHVGQHDLVKTCPLCSYRAGSMKSLRIHFFNRHGIDLDNPGASGTSSLLLALESQATQVAAAAAAAGFVSNLNAVAPVSAGSTNTSVSNSITNSSNSMMAHHSDSGDSVRSLENATPPMHFLTPHVEISTISDNGSEAYNGNMPSEAHEKGKERDFVIHSPVPPIQDQPLDCNTKSLPSSTSNISVQVSVSPKNHHLDNHITPSISLIPIKQEPVGEDLSNDKGKQKTPDQTNGGSGGGESSESEYSSPNNRMTALIKVSPLKSLLREDLKRRICAKANNRITRNAAALENNNVIQSASGVINSSCNSTPICNGTITSSGQESDTMLLNRKQLLTCLFCGIEFPDETLYFLHKGCHCDSNPWKCNICGEQCNNVYEFNSHLLSKSHQ